MDLLIQIRQALHRGEINPSLFVELCEMLVTKGDSESIIAVLQKNNVLEHVVAIESLMSGTDSGISQAGNTGNDWNLGTPSDLQIGDDVMSRAAQLRDQAAAGESHAPAKYELGDEIARGGVGKIQLVRDRDLMRTLVMKTLIKGHEVSDYVLQKFIEEAQITAQLEHPNIVPVHDFGYFSGGEVFFTMKRVAGRTMKEVLRAVRKNEGDAQKDFPRVKLLNMFTQVCMAIGFGHSRGVIHRDIKSSNVMTGAYGEILVLDWGIAKVLGREEVVPIEEGGESGESEESEERVSTLRSQSDDATMMGVVTGTPAYMSPEQAAGKVNEVDARSDVYALGALLYEILTYRPPFRGKNFRQTLAQVLTTPPVPPSQRAPDNNIPMMLESIAMKCLEKAREARYQSVKEIIEAVEQYMLGVEDRDRRARMSETKLAEGVELVEEYTRARATVVHLREELIELEWQIMGHEPLEQKRGMWTKQTQLAEHEAQVHQLFSRATQALMSAIGFNPDNDEASNELARLYWFKLRDAEGRNDEGEIIYYRGLVEAYNRGLFDELLKGEGRIIIRSDPPGARVTASRYVEIDKRLTTLMDEDLGFTQLNNIPLSNGSYLLTIDLDGYRAVTYPARVDRGEVTDVACQMFTEEEITEHYLYVPGGPFVMGGDETCTTNRHRRIVQVSDLFVSRFPVTCAEYLWFIQSLAHTDPAQAQARVPRLKTHSGFLWSIGASGNYELPPADPHGYQWEQYWPVFGVSFDDAAAYAHWYGQQTGIAVRLPSEEEWEKAARGTDARFYPWGDAFDATFCKMASSRVGEPQPERVGSFPADCSPYGVYDMAGLVAEYCNSQFASDPNVRVVKGGGFDAPADTYCRVTQRRAVSIYSPGLSYGFRLVREPPQAEAQSAQRLVRPSFD